MAASMISVWFVMPWTPIAEITTSALASLSAVAMEEKELKLTRTVLTQEFKWFNNDPAAFDLRVRTVISPLKDELDFKDCKIAPPRVPSAYIRTLDQKPWKID